MPAGNSNSDIIDITAIQRHETELAYLIDDGDKKVWVSKKLAQKNDDGTFSMPEWVALEKGLI